MGGWICRSSWSLECFGNGNPSDWEWPGQKNSFIFQNTNFSNHLWNRCKAWIQKLSKYFKFFYINCQFSALNRTKKIYKNSMKRHRSPLLTSWVSFFTINVYDLNIFVKIHFHGWAYYFISITRLVEVLLVSKVK